MDLNALMPWLLAASTILSLGTTVYTLMSAGSKQTATDLENHKTAQAQKAAAVDGSILDLTRRVQTVEGELHHLPNKDALHSLELTLRDMKVEMAKIAASADQSARTAQRVENYLQEKAR